MLTDLPDVIRISPKAIEELKSMIIEESKSSTNMAYDEIEKMGTFLLALTATALSAEGQKQ